MVINIILATTLIVIASSESISDVSRSIPEGITSAESKVIYGMEDLTVINEIVTDMEKNNALKSRVNLNEAIPPLPAMDVKCLMSADHYCSKEMGNMKKVLIQAVQNDCKECSIQQKEKAGRIVASMMAHDPVAWKLFLTRYNGLQKVQRILG